MTPSANLPVLGVCLPTRMLRMYRDWIIEDQRDLEIQDFFHAALLEGDWKAAARETLSLLQGYSGRLGIHGPFWGFSIGTMDPDVRKVVQRRLNQGLDACAEIGATQMVIHSPYTTWSHNNLDHLPGARQQMIDDTNACLAPVVARAEDLGVVLVIENIEDKDPNARVALARQFDSASVRVSVDTGHANYAHQSTGAPPSTITFSLRATCCTTSIFRTRMVSPIVTGRPAKATSSGRPSSKRWRNAGRTRD